MASLLLMQAAPSRCQTNKIHRAAEHRMEAPCRSSWSHVACFGAAHSAPERGLDARCRTSWSHVAQSGADCFSAKHRRQQLLHVHKLQASTTTEPITGLSEEEKQADEEIAFAKARLRRALASVQRGVEANGEQRAMIEEAQVDLEAMGGGTSGLETGGALDRLHGLWRLQYSNTTDVLGILRLPSLSPLPFPLLEVGDIYQNFICQGQESSGVLQNIVDWSVAGLLEEKKGARFVVTADFTVRSNSSLQLIFREAGVDSIRLSDTIQALLAPAVLPRTQLSLEVLQFFRSFQFSVPFQQSTQQGESGFRRPRTS